LTTLVSTGSSAAYQYGGQYEQRFDIDHRVVGQWSPGIPNCSMDMKLPKYVHGNP
jgi:hypothetical protein